MVLDPAGPIPERRLFHRRRAVAGAYRCFHRSIQRDSRAIRLDQEKGLPATVQKSPYHSTLIPSTSSTFAPAWSSTAFRDSAVPSHAKQRSPQGGTAAGARFVNVLSRQRVGR